MPRNGAEFAMFTGSPERVWKGADLPALCQTTRHEMSSRHIVNRAECEVMAYVDVSLA